MRRFRTFIECFVAVTTGIVFIAACTFSAQPAAMTHMTLWQILLSAGLCALSTAIFFPDEQTGKVRLWIAIGLHFVSLCVIMILCGRWFGWIGSSFPEAAAMVGYVVLVYAFTSSVSYLIERRQVTNLNRQLREKYGDPTEDAE